MRSLHATVQSGGLFQGYAYGYPHKTAYRPLAPPVALREAWQDEDLDGLFLYVHVPFCEMRCGFCNLFTTTGAPAAQVTSYLTALERQVEAYTDAWPRRPRLARSALGGGTPTFLSVEELARLFGLLRAFDGFGAAPLAVEMSPGTIDPAKLSWLREAGVTRASIGVQSFAPAETRALGRPQDLDVTRCALGWIRDARFDTYNIDLIYGMEGQTPASFGDSIRQAVDFGANEIFLYPLYVRPLTGLGRKGRAPADAREALYRAGRDFLLERGWRQISMRLFRAPGHAGSDGPDYCCQEDGMVGLGAGARSYTAALHYSTEWAVGRTGIQSIIEGYRESTPADFARIDYGVRLDAAEQRRRYVIKSILRADGLDLAAYATRFGSAAEDDFPELHELAELGAAEFRGGHCRPTQLGLEWSDVIGPWLYSAGVSERMRDYVLT